MLQGNQEAVQQLQAAQQQAEQLQQQLQEQQQQAAERVHAVEEVCVAIPTPATLPCPLPRQFHAIMMHSIRLQGQLACEQQACCKLAADRGCFVVV